MMKRKMISLLLIVFFVVNVTCTASGAALSGSASGAETAAAAETSNIAEAAGTGETADKAAAARTGETADKAAVAATGETAGTAATDKPAEEAETSKIAEPAEIIPFWSEDSPTMQQILSLVSSMTEETSDAYLPEEDRIAVFDFDGTLFGERFPTYFDNCLFLHRVLDDETFQAPADIKEYAQALRTALENGTEEPESPRSTAQMAAECFAGMTVEEYRAYVRDFMAIPAWGFENMTYGQGYFKPMTALVEYLAGRGFKIFVSSGSERAMVRELMSGTLDKWIPSERVIGSTFSLTATGQGDTSGRSYSFTPDDEVLMEGNLVTKNQKANKVFSIVDEIGKAPVLVFGNSSGDLSMAEYCLQHGGSAFMLLCDDLERDYGDLKTADKFKKTCQESGFHTVSMKEEFTSIYGDEVKKTAEEENKAAADGSSEVKNEAAADGSSEAKNEAAADGSSEAKTEASAADSARSETVNSGNASGTDRLSEIKNRGVLLVGATGDYRPMSYREPDTGEYWGFDADLAQDLADSLGVDLQYVPTSWPTLMDDTLAGKFDLAVCGITITDARKEQALMSEGYLVNGKTIICRSEDAAKYTDLESINKPEVRVMVNPGGLNEKFARENLPDVTLIIHDVNQDIPGLIAEGAADIMITEIMEAGYYVGQDERLAAPLINEPFTHGELGVLMPKGSEDLLEYVNAFLEEEKHSGRLDDLADEYIYQHQEKELAPAA
ncbi:MAG: transporter substrate-binding domain-containing protein [Sarcina sp.]|nr:transporter substrate-binding domain-containing protein [Sarcina sp.]